jgi:hypothetical protein
LGSREFGYFYFGMFSIEQAWGENRDFMNFHAERTSFVREQ